MDTVNVYDIKELKEQFPDSYEKVLNKWQNSQDEIFWQDEIIESLKECFKVAGITLKDWLLGGQGSYVKFDIPTYWSELADCDMLVDDYEGRRAYNWLKTAFDLKSYRRVYYTNHLGKKAHRYDFTKLNSKKDWDWSCEFTGYCADHDYLESLFDDIHDGMNLKDAFHNLADVCNKLIEQEIEYQSSEEYFLEHAEINDFQYTEYGVRV